MSLKIFLKLYARLAGIAALVGILCVVLFNGLNSVRHQFWLERFPEPLMRWLAESPAPERQYHWLSAWYDLKRLPAGEMTLSPVVRERLGYGQVVAEEAPTGFRLMVETPSGNILQIRFEEPYFGVSRALALVVRWHLDSVDSAGREDVAARLGGHLGVSITRLDQASMLPPDPVLQQIAEQGVVLYGPEQGDRRNALVRLADGTLLLVGLPAPFSPFGWPVLSLLVLLIGSVLALALWLALKAVDNNLRQVESVAIRIARGEMGARVEAGTSTLVSRLAAAFNGMAEHIQRLVQVQREMIHAVSHELRTPVARIRFGVQMIEDCQDQKMLHKQLEGIDGDIQELDELIDEILTYARLEQGGPVFSLREHSVTEIVRQVVSEQRVIRPNLTIDSDIDDDTEHFALSDIEPRYIHRAIQNLVGNAGRYASGRVLVRCRIDEDNCRVDVEDDGPGVPEEDWEKVFTAFARLDDSRTRTSGGYGLGLSIVRRILYWHGGQAFVSRSEELGGARFSLVWPRRKPADTVL
ncbi:ATP-binding protein [Marinobacter pelagius]|uniref:ATP-binding protein n=1 Tax=Marinobacter sp. C7 TaxID=2951363 RepID=UPI001EF13D6F|nr:ATP-binding protein [Marinobacter sp. C7]MCG7201094.1 ATP-binding protein [Marinobacter sp. C7]